MIGKEIRRKESVEFLFGVISIFKRIDQINKILDPSVSVQYFDYLQNTFNKYVWSNLSPIENSNQRMENANSECLYPNTTSVSNGCFVTNDDGFFCAFAGTDGMRIFTLRTDALIRN